MKLVYRIVPYVLDPNAPEWYATADDARDAIEDIEEYSEEEEYEVEEVNIDDSDVVKVLNNDEGIVLSRTLYYSFAQLCKQRGDR